MSRYELISVRGFMADRSQRTSRSNALVAKRLNHQFGIPLRHVNGSPPVFLDHWKDALEVARKPLFDMAGAVEETLAASKIPVLIANTCSASLGSVPVAARYNANLQLLWIDGHGDFNTPDTTQSNYLGGMVLAALCGLWESGHGAGIRPENVLLLGAHDLDGEERRLVDNSGIRIISSALATPEAVLSLLDQCQVWIHVDWDALKPGFIDADYKMDDGLEPSQLHAIFEALGPERVAGIELAEFSCDPGDPTIDRQIINIAATISPLLSIALPEMG